MNDYVGQVKVGNDVAIQIICTTDGVSIGTPDSAPTYTIRDEDGSTMTSGTGTMTQVSGSLYRLKHSLTSGNGYTAGSQYFVDIRYAVSAANKMELKTLQCT